MMEHDSGWHSKPTLTPSTGQSEVHLRRQRVRKAMERQGGLMGDYASLLGPEPGGHQLLVIGSWKVNKPVEPALGPCHAASLDVLSQELGGVTRLRSLFCCEIARLAGCNLEQSVPTRFFKLRLAHSQNVTPGLVLCKYVQEAKHTHRTRDPGTMNTPRRVASTASAYAWMTLSRSDRRFSYAAPISLKIWPS